MTNNTITVQELHEKLNSGGATLLDVREYPEFTGGHIAGARLMPLGELCADMSKAPAGEVFLICRSGRRAQTAAERLCESECCPVVVEGGIEAWKAAGLPLQTISGPISLERQVRIAAGSLVLLGLLAKRLRGVSYFVACGLIFAGVTDKCGMALLLAKLPWNKRR